MRKNIRPKFSPTLLIFFLLALSAKFSTISAQSCKPSGFIRAKSPPSGHCNIENDSLCCRKGQIYATYECSPGVSKRTKALMTIDSFQSGGDGGWPSKCDHQYHSDDTPVVALSTGWFNRRSRCLQNITIFWTGRSVDAMVVGECNSAMGCDSEHNYLPPCQNNIVVASKAVWKALHVPMNQWGQLDVLWSDSN